MDEMIKKWLDLGTNKTDDTGNHRTRVYMFTEANPVTQSLFKLDFHSFGVNQVGVYQQTESCWNWVATVDFSKGDQLTVGVNLADAKNFGAADIDRLMKTFAASCGVSLGGTSEIIDPQEEPAPTGQTSVATHEQIANLARDLVRQSISEVPAGCGFDRKFTHGDWLTNVRCDATGYYHVSLFNKAEGVNPAFQITFDSNLENNGAFNNNLPHAELLKILTKVLNEMKAG